LENYVWKPVTVAVCTGDLWTVMALWKNLEEHNIRGRKMLLGGVVIPSPFCSLC